MMRQNSVHKNPVLSLYVRSFFRNASLYKSNVRILRKTKLRKRRIKYRRFLNRSRPISRRNSRYTGLVKGLRANRNLLLNKKIKRRINRSQLLRAIKKRLILPDKTLKIAIMTFYKTSSNKYVRSGYRATHRMHRLSTHVNKIKPRTRRKRLKTLLKYSLNRLRVINLKTVTSKNLKFKNALCLEKPLVSIKPRRPILSKFKFSTHRIKSINVLKRPVLSYISLFLRFKINVLNFKFKSEKFLMKKKIFSFLKPNEAKRAIMHRRRRIHASRFYKRLKKSDMSFVELRLVRKPKFSFRNKDSFSTRLNVGYYKRTSSNRTDSSELFLPRVKFKPGYQRI
jgi:hypothetical protein